MSQDNIDEILNTTDTENQEIIKLLTIKKHILTFLDKQEIVNFLIKLVKKSKVLKFQRDNPENYIIPTMPLLEIEIIEDVAKNVSDYKKLYNEAGNDRKKILDVRAKIVKDVILDNFTNLMVDLYQVLVKNKASEESVYRKDIDKILKDKNTDPLAINSIYKLEDDNELLFIFSLVYAVNFPYDNEDIDITKDFSCGVEFLI